MTSVCVAAAEKTSVDTSKNVLELARVAAPVSFNLGEVDVEVSVGWQIRRSTVDDGLGDVKCEISVDLAVERRGSVPPSRFTRLARESDGRNLRCRCSIRGSANRSGEGGLDSNIGADIGTGQGKLGSGAVPEFRRSDIDALFDRSHLSLRDQVSLVLEHASI
jgi:hypothetical protein